MIYFYNVYRIHHITHKMYINTYAPTSIIALVVLVLLIVTLFVCAAYNLISSPTKLTTHPAVVAETFVNNTVSSYNLGEGGDWSEPAPTNTWMTGDDAVGSNCPTCRWECDDEQTCPQVCSSECAPPQCAVRCRPLAPANCTVSCAPPKCRIVCPSDDKCQRGRCNLCKTVCDPPQCTVKCVEPTPDCVAQCAPPDCRRVCQKPADCPQPNCRMVCE